jgi:hypothetical protein
LVTTPKSLCLQDEPALHNAPLSSIVPLLILSLPSLNVGQSGFGFVLHCFSLPPVGTAGFIIIVIISSWW